MHFNLHGKAIADVPDSLCEAAKIDGAGPFRIYWV